MNGNEFVTATPRMFPQEWAPAYRQSLAHELNQEAANGTAYPFRDGSGRVGVFLPLQQLNIPIEHYPLCSMLRSLENALAALDMWGAA